ncbi:MAG: hypothetical protein ABIP58_04945 [Dehalococcoidia bacterium]
MISPTIDDEGVYSPLQLHFLRRLNRLLRLRVDQSTDLNGEGLRLIDRTIYSTYCDAVDLGVPAEAQALVQRVSAPAKSVGAEK